MKWIVIVLTTIVPALAMGQQSPSPTFQLEDNALVLPAPIEFDAGTDQLKPRSEKTLEYARTYVEAKTYLSLLRIENHSTDGAGAKANQLLSEKRAMAVARWLVAKGVDCKRLLPVGFGDTKPIADRTSAEAHSKNNRTVVVSAALRGRPIGGMPVDGGGKVAGDPCR